MLTPTQVQTLFAMLRARQFTTTPKQEARVNELASTRPEETHWFEFAKAAPVAGDSSLCVLLLPVAKLGIALMRKQVAHLEEKGWTHALAIVQNGITPQAVQTQRSLLRKGVRFETFTRDKLSFDIMRHHKVPPHRVLSRDEIRALGLNAATHKHMLSTDAVACYLGLQPGDAVEITRYTPIARVKVYRVVVAS